MGAKGANHESYDPRPLDRIDPWLGQLSQGPSHQAREIASDLGLTPEAYERLEADAGAEAASGRPDATERAGLIDRLLSLLQRWAHGLGSHDELALLSDSQRQELARDLSLSVGELDRLASSETTMPELVHRRLAEIGFTMDEAVASGIASRTDLERTCALCDGRLTCEHDLVERPDSPEWRQFCPNIETFRALEAALVAKAPVKSPEK